MEIFRKKNEATVIAFPMVTTANPETFDTGETVSDTGYYSDAGGAWTTLAITDTVSEIGSTGMYELSLTAGEMNHDNIIIKFTSTNAADTAVVIRTRAVDEDDLVRATTPANTLDVNATGEVGLDLDNTSGTLTSSEITSAAGVAVSSIGTGVITATSIAAGAITDTEFTATGSGLSAMPWNAAWDAEVQSECADALTAFWTSPATLVDLIWDEDVDTSHQTAGTAGKKLDDAGGAADPWATALPGAYGAGTAGEIIGDWKNAGRLDAILDTIAADVVNIDGIVPAAAGDAMTLAAGAVTNASLAGNMEIVFETDFATNYNTTRNAWVTNYTDVIGTDPVTAFDPPTRTELTSDINGLNDLDAAGIRAAVGLAAANMDTQFTASATATSVDLNAGAITNASLAGNMEIVFETDFATNYNTTRNAWATNAQDFVGTSAADPFNGQVIAASVTGAVGSVTGHTNQTGDTYALANGAEGFAAINTDVELILADTGELQTDWTDGGRLDLLVDAIKVVTDALTSAGAGNLALSAAGIIGGTAQTGTLSTTVMTSDLTGYENDELIGRTIIWTGGTADGQASDITDYASASGTVTYTAITTLPANGDTFVIV